MSTNVILLRPVLRIVLVTESVLLTMEQLMSCPLVAVIASETQLRNMHQTFLSTYFREELKIL